MIQFRHIKGKYKDAWRFHVLFRFGISTIASVHVTYKQKVDYCLAPTSILFCFCHSKTLVLMKLNATGNVNFYLILATKFWFGSLWVSAVSMDFHYPIHWYDAALYISRRQLTGCHSIYNVSQSDSMFVTRSDIYDIQH